MRISSIGMLLMTAFSQPRAGLEESWKQSGFPAFSQGTFEDSGANIYVSRRGGIQIINRLDLNRDGYLDILIGNGHDHTEDEDIYAYLNNGEEVDPLRRISIPAQGAVGGLVEDLNRDGYNDLVVVNSSGMGFQVDSFIYYGTEQGFPISKRQRLQAWKGRNVAAADWNGDGWTDLAFACANPGKDGSSEESVIYWNSPEGFKPERKSVLPGAGVWALAEDLNGDGHIDLALAHENKLKIHWHSDGKLELENPLTIGLQARHLTAEDLDGDGYRDLIAVTPKGVEVLPGSERGPRAKQSETIPVQNPVQSVAVDLNRDGRPDLAVTIQQQMGNEYTDSLIFWNDGGRLKADRFTALPTVRASGISAGDLNQDGWPDLVISNTGSINNLSIQSFIYWNREGRFQLAWKSMMDTRGSRTNCIGDVNNDGLPDVVFFNFEGGLRSGYNPNVIYWGDGSRNYSGRRSTQLWSGYNVGTVQADFNDDGWTDVGSIEDRYAHGRPETLHGVYLWYGGPEGYLEERRAALSVQTPGSGLRAADLNRDGYLDLIVGAGEPDGEGRIGNVVLWGGANGYSAGRRQVIPIGSKGRAPVVADFDRDGHLDLAGGSYDPGVLLVYGSEQGLRLDEITDLLPGWTVLDVEAADLDGDGWLDLILPGIVPPNREGKMFLHYGSPEGFTGKRMTSLPHLDGHDPSVADFNRDGYLDIAVSNEGGNSAEGVPDYIFWGGPGGFDPLRRQELPGESGAASIPADFDGDGWIDLLMVLHKRAGNPDRVGTPVAHNTDSFLFWNGPDGFDASRRTPIRTSGPHSQIGRDPGNIYDRSLAERYISAPYRPENGSLKPAALGWTAEIAPRTAVRFQIRTAADRAGLQSAEWQGPEGPGTWFEQPGPIPPAIITGPWLQYRAELSTLDGGNSPVLTEVECKFR